jgi:hypothetical protein
MLRWRWLCVAATILGIASSVSRGGYAQAKPTPDLKAALRKFDDLYRSDSSVAELEMSVMNDGNARELRMHAFTRGADKALILIEAPARDKGTATLRVHDNLWNYLPRIARTIRVPPYAVRGLGRNVRRSALSALGVGIGCAIGLITIAWIRGEGEMIVRAAAESGAGHLRIVPANWPVRRDRRLRLPD